MRMRHAGLEWCGRALRPAGDSTRMDAISGDASPARFLAQPVTGAVLLAPGVTPRSLRLYWIGFDGFLTEYGLVQPDESASFGTFVGHQCLAEAYTPDGAECLGPISANDQSGCDMHILYDNGFGYDAGMCDF
jgi:hypothetical protein